MIARDLFRVHDVNLAWEMANAHDVPLWSTTMGKIPGLGLHLVCLPIDDPERARLSDRIKAKGLDSRARKFLSCRPESFWGSTARKLAEPEPPYTARLWSLTSGLFTRQSPCTVSVPTWAPGTIGEARKHVAVTVAEYIEQFDRLNGLVREVPARQRLAA